MPSRPGGRTGRPRPRAAVAVAAPAGAAAAPSSAAAVAPAATPSMFRLLRRWVSSGSVWWVRLMPGTPLDVGASWAGGDSWQFLQAQVGQQVAGEGEFGGDAVGEPGAGAGP